MFDGRESTVTIGHTPTHQSLPSHRLVRRPTQAGPPSSQCLPLVSVARTTELLAMVLQTVCLYLLAATMAGTTYSGSAVVK